MRRWRCLKGVFIAAGTPTAMGWRWRWAAPSPSPDEPHGVYHP